MSVKVNKNKIEIDLNIAEAAQLCKDVMGFSNLSRMNRKSRKILRDLEKAVIEGVEGLL